MRSNLHIYLSPFKNESRILKEIHSILEYKLVDKIIIAASWADGLPEREDLNSQITLIRIKTIFDTMPKNLITDLLRFISYSFIAFNIFKKDKSISFVNCHSLSVLPIGWLLKRRNRIKLIYDAHELETERAGMNGLKQKFSKWLERRLIYKCDSVIVVGEFIAKWYEKEYSINNVSVLRNIPTRRSVERCERNIFREKWNIPQEHVIYIYQGVINYGRGIDSLLETFSKLPKNIHLVIMGYGGYTDKVIEAERLNLNIHYQEAVKPSEIPVYTSCADIGLNIIENVGLSYYYSLPNKFFEYLYCGLPVIASNFPEVSKIINKENCGWLIEPNTDELYNLISTISSEDLEIKKSNLSSIPEMYNWDKDSEVLKKVLI